MENYPGLDSKPRNSVRQPEEIDLFKGLAWMAAGVVGISFLATSVSIIFKMIFCILGMIFLGIAGKWIRKYSAAYKAFQQFVPQWDSRRGIYDTFAEELNEWQKNGVLPACCDGDTLYFLKLQKERLKKKGLIMVNQVMPVKGTGFGTATLSRKSSWYTTDMIYENIHRKIRFDDRKETIYEREVEQVMYEIVVHTPNDEQLSNITMTCPNCGAVSRVAALEDGCRYCNTRFRITDLFPRVANLFFLKNRSTASVTGMISQSVFFCMLTVLLLEIPFLLFSQSDFLPGRLAVCFLSAGVGGGIIGWILASMRLFLSLFDGDGMKHISLFKWMSSKKKITDLMKKYDTNFSFDKFEGTIVALIRMAVFAEDPETLACYRGGKRSAEFADILEMTYTNGICLNSVRMDGNILHMSLRTWWVNYSADGKHIRKTGDCIDVELSRNVAMIEPPGFSITSVSCPYCGGSFDAVRQRCCPYCGGEYHMENEGWVIDDMRLLR